MGSPERVQPQYLADTGAPQQQAQQKFVSDAYPRANDKTGSDPDQPKRERLFDGHVFKNIFGPKKKDGDKPDVKKGDEKDEKDAVKLEKEGGVESLKLPKGYTKGDAEKEENYMEFPSGTNKDMKICYWRRSDYAATDEDTKKINEIMKKPPHELKEQEILDMIPTMAPGRWAGNGNFKQLSLRTEDVGGKRVIVGDFNFNDKDKKVHVMIANPDKDKHQIEVIWAEGPKKDLDQNKKDIDAAFHQIKWTDGASVNQKQGKK